MNITLNTAKLNDLVPEKENVYSPNAKFSEATVQLATLIEVDQDYKPSSSNY
jgi:hypothetical protein